ncbi:uncharacterized protein PGTG_16650 [Puccinia graminis f. sp. tritici CRL 75-36-700-3]|uniref:Uncharacterized protein n=1 Tax=Puccinia graminis f. sp. tritici (strain CRL 75-36-700-3 / race SCCL) TaxID=418459 RepID=E3L249_PUCGT|nr:uncharacterized protein PGTG_16650 [Puccinia graminis f. sp. tritici CRL 75-36-700-3]EFP90624.1 hypothetical protein PGTG_16650 [Puccinia graminis f. sp. tritici CRL 75-36-700-3]
MGRGGIAHANCSWQWRTSRRSGTLDLEGRLNLGSQTDGKSSSDSMPSNLARQSKSTTGELNLFLPMIYTSPRHRTQKTGNLSTLLPPFTMRLTVALLLLLATPITLLEIKLRTTNWAQILTASCGSESGQSARPTNVLYSSKCDATVGEEVV